MRRWQLWIGLIVSLFFLVWAFQQVNSFGEVMAALSRANYLLIVPALVVYFVGVWVRAERWKYLLAPLKGVPAARLFPVMVMGYMANDVLPVRMGEVVRAYLIGRQEQISGSAGLATIFVERILDGVTLLFFAVVVSLFVPLGDGLQNIVRASSVVFALAIVAFIAVAFSPRLGESLISLMLKIAPRSVRPGLAEVATSFIDGLKVIQNGGLLLKIFALSALAWLCEAGVYYLVAYGFALGQPFYVLLLTVVVANLGTMVPSSPGYIGTFEALGVFTLGLFKVSPDLAMSYVLVLHVALLVPVTLLGFFYLWQQQLSLSAIGHAPAAETASLRKENSV